MTQYHTFRLHHRRDWLQMQLDGEIMLHKCVFREEHPTSDFHRGESMRRTQFRTV